MTSDVLLSNGPKYCHILLHAAPHHVTQQCNNKIRFTLLPIVWPPAGSQVDPYAPEMPLTTLNIPHHVVICTHHPAPRLLRNVVLTWYWPGNVVLWWWSPSWWFGLMPCKCWSGLLQILHYSSMWIKAKHNAGLGQVCLKIPKLCLWTATSLAASCSVAKAKRPRKSRPLSHCCCEGRDKHRLWGTFTCHAYHATP